MPPRVEAKFPLVNFQELVYPRIMNTVLEAKQKDILFTIVHGIYRNRKRLHQQNRTENAFCPNQAACVTKLGQLGSGLEERSWN